MWMRLIGTFTNTCNDTITRLRYTVWFEVRGMPVGRRTFDRPVRFLPGGRIRVDYAIPNPTRRRSFGCQISFRWWF